YRRLLDTLQSTAGIESATIARYSIHRGDLNFVAPGLFSTLGLPIVAGRDLTWSDVTGAARVAIVSDSAARTFFPDGRAIGRVVPAAWAGRLAPLTIVGVAHDITLSYRPSPAHPAVFVAYTHASPSELGQMNVFVRTAGAAAARASEVLAAVQSVDPDLALSE